MGRRTTPISIPSGSTTESTGVGYVFLEWADPPTGSSNDYDRLHYQFRWLRRRTMQRTIRSQSGSSSSIPFEVGIAQAGYRLYILKKAAAATRALHLTTLWHRNTTMRLRCNLLPTARPIGHSYDGSMDLASLRYPQRQIPAMASYNPNAGSSFKSNNTSEILLVGRPPHGILYSRRAVPIWVRSPLRPLRTPFRTAYADVYRDWQWHLCRHDQRSTISLSSRRRMASTRVRRLRSRPSSARRRQRLMRRRSPVW